MHSGGTVNTFRYKVTALKNNEEDRTAQTPSVSNITHTTTKLGGQVAERNGIIQFRMY